MENGWSSRAINSIIFLVIALVFSLLIPRAVTVAVFTTVMVMG